MKQKLVFVLWLAIISGAAFAQNGDNPKKKGTAAGIHLNAVDFITPTTFNNSGAQRKIANFKQMDYGFSLSYWKGLTSKVDFSVKLNGLLYDYAEARGEFTDKTEVGLELEPSINIRPINDNNLVAPFLSAGIGAGYYTGKFAAYVPAGVGIQFNFNSVAYVVLQAGYRFSLDTKVVKDNLLYSLGVLQSFGPERPAALPPPPPPPMIMDRDGDGVPDADDKCPDTPGLASLQGCPDRDGDGIADGDDKCPDVAGIAKYQGCPIPDTDGDGINDEMDKCPTVKGVARYQGCPIPDTDGDGVNDEEDKCPTRPGPASNKGCPEIAKEVIEKVNFAAKNVFYATASYKLLAKSFKSLNEVAALMIADESLRLQIDGHTDSQGTDEYNQTLSDNRAKSVKDYLVSKGVAENRLASSGYGETKPVADNNTVAGRAKNRRTEMTVSNY